jgi:hypothetical protein
MRTPEPDDELRPEYRLEDLGPLERGKHFAAAQKGTNLVLLRPEVAMAFPTAEAVNEALLGLMKLASRVGSSPDRRKPRRARSAVR